MLICGSDGVWGTGRDWLETQKQHNSKGDVHQFVAKLTKWILSWSIWTATESLQKRVCLEETKVLAEKTRLYVYKLLGLIKQWFNAMQRGVICDIEENIADHLMIPSSLNSSVGLETENLKVFYSFSLHYLCTTLPFCLKLSLT